MVLNSSWQLGVKSLKRPTLRLHQVTRGQLARVEMSALYRWSTEIVSLGRDGSYFPRTVIATTLLWLSVLHGRNGQPNERLTNAIR